MYIIYLFLRSLKDVEKSLKSICLTEHVREQVIQHELYT